MKHYHVVAAIIRHDGEILCMQKGEMKFAYTSFKFEFPGGKVEAGETEPQALMRELREEMAYNVQVERAYLIVHHVYPDFEITMTSYLCDVRNRDFRMNEHHAYQWLPPQQLLTLDWAAADQPIAKQLSLDF